MRIESAGRSAVVLADGHVVDWTVATRCRYEHDITLIPHARGHCLNPMVENDRWTCMGIDATMPLPREKKHERATMPEVDLENCDMSRA